MPKPIVAPSHQQSLDDWERFWTHAMRYIATDQRRGGIVNVARTWTDQEKRQAVASLRQLAQGTKAMADQLGVALRRKRPADEMG